MADITAGGRLGTGALIDAIATGWRAYLTLTLLVVAVSLPGVLALQTWDRDEARYAQATAQMLETDDYIDIRYQDVPRYKKPIAIYWAQSLSTEVLSDASERHIWTYRLPSLISAVLAVWGLYWAGLALFGRGQEGRRASFIGAALLSVCILPSTEAHIAKTDAALLASTVWAMGCLARLRAGIGDPGRMAIGFWAAMGLGVLIKGPIAPLVGFGGAALLWLWERRNDWVRPLLKPVGPLVFTAIALPWFVLVETVGEGGFLRDAFMVDFAPKVSGGGEHPTRPPGFHFIFLAIFSFPMAIILPAAFLLIWRAARGGRDAPDFFAERFLVVWFVPVWIVFEIATTKLAHYTLPAYPPLALLGGLAVSRLMSADIRTRWWFAGGLTAVVGGLFAFLMWPTGGLALVQAEALGDYGEAGQAAANAWAAMPETPNWPSVIVLGLSLAAAALLVLKRQGAALASGIAAAAVLGVALRAAILPNLLWMQPTTMALSALDEVCGRPIDAPPACVGVTPPARLDAIDYSEPSFVFETGTFTRLPPISGVDLEGVAATDRIAWLLNVSKPNGEAALAQLQLLAEETGRPIRRSEPRYVINYSNGNAAIFVAVALDAAPIAAQSTAQ